MKSIVLCLLLSGCASYGSTVTVCVNCGSPPPTPIISPVVVEKSIQR